MSLPFKHCIAFSTFIMLMIPVPTYTHSEMGLNVTNIQMCVKSTFAHGNENTNVSSKYKWEVRMFVI